MSLARTKSGYNYTGEYEDSSLTKIAIAERRLAAKKQVVEDMQNELDLIERQTFETYKHEVLYLLLDQQKTIKQCRDWISMQKKQQDKDGNKIDGRKKYPEKEMYTYYIDTIKKYLGIDSMEDVEFIDFNFGQATEIRFTYLEHRWELSIPHIQHIQLVSYQRYGADEFKLHISHRDVEYTHSWTRVGETFDEEELKDIMAKGFEKFVKSVEVYV